MRWKRLQGSLTRLARLGLTSLPASDTSTGPESERREAVATRESTVGSTDPSVTSTRTAPVPDAYDPKGPLMSSGKDDWQTPDRVLDCVHEMTAVIGLDPCAGHDTDHAVTNWCWPGSNGLVNLWTGKGLVYVNPPYSDLKNWMGKVIHEAGEGAEIVMLLPARTDTIAFQMGLRWSTAVCFIAGRLKYLDHGKPVKNSAPFPSCVLYFGNRWASFVDAFSPLGHTSSAAHGWVGLKAGDHASTN